MKRVTGIGGVFFKAKDPAALRAWYKTHLGVDVQAWGGAVFDWTDAAASLWRGRRRGLFRPRMRRNMRPAPAAS
jgi:hypothetical protein